MRKTYQWILASLLCMMGAMNVNAEEISLEEVPFWQHESAWGLEAPKTTPATPAWIVGEPAGTVYGDDAVINFADLSAYTKLVVTLVEDTEGSPRFLFNRDVDEGQWNESEAESHLIDNTRGGWSAKYFSQEGNVYTVDLKQLVKDKGYAHLHAIKGANWSDVTVESMVVVSQGKAKEVGWVNLINNSNMEGDDVSSFFTKVAKGDPMPSEITDGVGVNDSRGIVVEATAKESDAWDNQFWFRFNEIVPADAKYRVSFDYRADAPATVSTQAHAEPSDYIHYEMLGNIEFTTEWQTFTKEGVITASQAGPNDGGGMFQSIAFNLNELADANNYYFDNITFEIYKAGTRAEFSDDVVLIDFGFDTNIPELVAASGSRRIFFPNDCVTVKANGKEQGIFSVEGLEDGRFYIFLEDGLDEDDVVEVTFTNPSGANHLTYASGPNAGADVANFSGIADNNESIQENEGYPYVYVTPTVMSADPDDGSFNLPNSISEFKVKFDKKVDCAALQATINGAKLSVSPASGFAEEVTLTHSGTFADGEYTITLTKIYPEERLDDSIYGEYSYKVSIGEIIDDPNDQPYDLIPADYFANTAGGGIPEGFIVMFGEEERTSDGGTYGSGSRMMDFAEGGDFTKGLYFREGYVDYGSTDGYELSMEAGKKYKIHFNSAMWKDNGSQMTFEIQDMDENAVMSETIRNTPNANGSYAALTGTTVTDITFIPEESGNYRLRWIANGFVEVLLANVTCSYMPNKPGAEEKKQFDTALENAKNTLAENDQERYHGSAFDALKNAIAQYDGQSWSSPSKYKEAAEALDAAVLALKEHRQNCDTYDEQIKKALDVVRQNRENKFAKTELYSQLTAIVSKYHGTSEWVNIGDEENPETELNYSFDVLTDDSQLQSAIAELKDIANMTSLLFTEGVSAPENANGGKGTGVAVFIDRLRLGAETLKALGAGDDPMVAIANNALKDDDTIADNLKLVVTQVLYGQLKEADNTLFQETVNEETLDTEVPSYDMTVFVKNPNIYKQEPNINFTSENVPGWTTPEGYNAPGLTVGWGAPKNVEGVAEDCMFQTWGGTYRVEQTISDLPVGVYTVKFAFGDRDNQEFDDSYAFVATSDGEEIQSGMIPGIGQAFPFVSNDSQTCTIEDITVTDGQLTIGVNAGDGSHTFFNEVRILMTAPVAGFDYAKAYIDGIDDVATEASKVRAIELYDLNGRRISKARQGVVLVKKQMSDGTIRTEKVIKK